MRSPPSNPDIYATVELERWANRTELLHAEQFLFARYLQPWRPTLDAGTGAGRIVFALRGLGFSSLAGFDAVPIMIARAKQADLSNQIRFTVQDAVSLRYENESFDQVIYLQQLLCFIEEERDRLAALREAWRVLRPGGIALFSFLSVEAREKTTPQRQFVRYLRMFRTLRGSPRSLQHLPWLRLNGQMNGGALLDHGPYLYWYRLPEVLDQLRAAQFEVVAVGSTRQIENGRICEHPILLDPRDIAGMLYVVARRPAA